MEEIQRIPKVSPKKMIPYWIFKIIDECKKLSEKGKRACPAYLKRDFKIPYSEKAIRKIMRKNGFFVHKRNRTQKKKDLRSIKAKMAVFEKIQIDIKCLNDIPEFYTEYTRYNLPQYQITARCVRSGALFISYALEKTVTNTTPFLLLLDTHFRKHGVDTSKITIQTDNGTEFVAPWNSDKKSSFTKAAEYILKAQHKTIPPSASTYNSDVETSHNLIENEFYAYKSFNSSTDFYDKAYQYTTYFNFDRFNRYKGCKPVSLLETSNFNIAVLDFKPVVVDNLLKCYFNDLKSLAS